MEYQMLRLNSKKDSEIEDHVPQSHLWTQAPRQHKATQGKGTWYRDSIKAFIHDKQILSSVNNMHALVEYE